MVVEHLLHLINLLKRLFNFLLHQIDLFGSQLLIDLNYLLDVSSNNQVHFGGRNGGKDQTVATSNPRPVNKLRVFALSRYQTQLLQMTLLSIDLPELQEVLCHGVDSSLVVWVQFKFEALSGLEGLVDQKHILSHFPYHYDWIASLTLLNQTGTHLLALVNLNL